MLHNEYGSMGLLNAAGVIRDSSKELPWRRRIILRMIVCQLTVLLEL